MENGWLIGTEENKILVGGNMYVRHSVHHKSHSIEPGNPCGSRGRRHIEEKAIESMQGKKKTKFDWQGANERRRVEMTLSVFNQKNCRTFLLEIINFLKLKKKILYGLNFCPCNNDGIQYESSEYLNEILIVRDS